MAISSVNKIDFRKWKIKLYDLLTNTCLPQTSAHTLKIVKQKGATATIYMDTILVGCVLFIIHMENITTRTADLGLLWLFSISSWMWSLSCHESLVSINLASAMKALPMLHGYLVLHWPHTKWNPVQSKDKLAMLVLTMLHGYGGVKDADHNS